MSVTFAGVSEPTKLRRLRLRRISLVDDPANEGARVVLFKRAEGATCNECDRPLLVGAQFCAECGEEVSKMYQQTASDQIMTLVENLVQKDAKLARADAYDRVIAANPDLWRRHVSEHRYGSAPIVKAGRDATTALDEAAKGLVSKSAGSVSYADALGQLMRTDSGRALYNAHCAALRAAGHMWDGSAQQG